MNPPIEKSYFDWLCSQFEVYDGREYYELFELLHNKEFVWIVPNDDNRAADAVELRVEFLGGGRHTFRDGASLLEVIVALSRRLAFAGEELSAELWAWQLLVNLHLHKMSDPLSRRKREIIDGDLEALIWRTYDRDGMGGFFPLMKAKENQTKVEIWYQMQAYIIERHTL